jgi:hypothetical protein
MSVSPTRLVSISIELLLSLRIPESAKGLWLVQLQNCTLVAHSRAESMRGGARQSKNRLLDAVNQLCANYEITGRIAS